MMNIEKLNQLADEAQESVLSLLNLGLNMEKLCNEVTPNCTDEEYDEDEEEEGTEPFLGDPMADKGATFSVSDLYLKTISEQTEPDVTLKTDKTDRMEPDFTPKPHAKIHVKPSLPMLAPSRKQNSVQSEAGSPSIEITSTPFQPSSNQSSVEPLNKKITDASILSSGASPIEKSGPAWMSHDTSFENSIILNKVNLDLQGQESHAFLKRMPSMNPAVTSKFKLLNSLASSEDESNNSKYEQKKESPKNIIDKLSIQHMPSINIKRQLVIQKVFNINISGSSKNTECLVNSNNVKYMEFKHDSIDSNNLIDNKTKPKQRNSRNASIKESIARNVSYIDEMRKQHKLKNESSYLKDKISNSISINEKDEETFLDRISKIKESIKGNLEVLTYTEKGETLVDDTVKHFLVYSADENRPPEKKKKIVCNKGVVCQTDLNIEKPIQASVSSVTQTVLSCRNDKELMEQLYEKNVCRVEVIQNNTTAQTILSCGNDKDIKNLFDVEQKKNMESTSEKQEKEIETDIVTVDVATKLNNENLSQFKKPKKIEDKILEHPKFELDEVADKQLNCVCDDENLFKLSENKNVYNSLSCFGMKDHYDNKVTAIRNFEENKTESQSADAKDNQGEYVLVHDVSVQVSFEKLLENEKARMTYMSSLETPDTSFAQNTLFGLYGTEKFEKLASAASTITNTTKQLSIKNPNLFYSRAGGETVSQAGNTSRQTYHTEVLYDRKLCHAKQADVKKLMACKYSDIGKVDNVGDTIDHINYMTGCPNATALKRRASRHLKFNKIRARNNAATEAASTNTESPHRQQQQHDESTSEGEVPCRCPVATGELHSCPKRNHVVHTMLRPPKKVSYDKQEHGLKVKRQHIYNKNWISYYCAKGENNNGPGISDSLRY